jgi:hypothetical protein
LPGTIATQKLTELISHFPEISSAGQDSAKIAARLTALLPGRARVKLPTLKSHPNAKSIASTQSALSVFFMTLAVVLGIQLIIGESRQTAPAASGTQTASSNNFPSRLPSFGGPRFLLSGN